METALTSEKWLEEGLRTLEKTGYPALRADPLAKQLGVSRGSFYWHFKDVASYHLAVLKRWEEAAVDRPLQRILRIEKTRDTALKRLIELAFTNVPTLERAVRGWALVFAPAAASVAIVDQRRISGLVQMFKRGGASCARAEASAAVLYWAYLGRIHSIDTPIAEVTMAEILARLGTI